MLYSRDELELRVKDYCVANAIQMQQRLGFGAQGIVFATDRATAIKVHGFEPAYRRERDVYVRLQENEVAEIRGLVIPRLRQFDDARQIIEMDLVSPPFILDFGAAYLDDPPEFPTDPHTQSEQEQEQREMFGPNRPEVQRVLRALQTYGIYMTDVHPGNIRFREQGTSGDAVQG
jgi:hypothetical protein